jgi:glycosyltransferase involved in cell wall biosynthesis
MFFSIIIPCYNHGMFLRDCLESIRNQEYSNWEAIIINDGSTDNSEQIACQFSLIDSRIKFISQPNKGLSTSRNMGLSNSKGDFILFLDADDIIASSHLSNFIPFFKKEYDIIFTGHAYFTFDFIFKRTIYLSNTLQFSSILHSNLLPVHAVAIRKKTLLLSGYFDTTLESAEDWDLWIRVYKIGAKLAIISNASTAFYRISDNSMSRNFYTMYNNLKIVSLRAFSNDSRISEHVFKSAYQNNSSYLNVKNNLLLCLGVAICQNKIKDAIELFNSEQKLFNFLFNPSDFKLMCSYLSFRYHVSKSDVNYAFEVLYPRFTQFLTGLNFSDSDQKVILSEIFSVHTKLHIRYKWGFLSPFINRFN